MVLTSWWWWLTKVSSIRIFDIFNVSGCMQILVMLMHTGCGVFIKWYISEFCFLKLNILMVIGSVIGWIGWMVELLIPTTSEQSLNFSTPHPFIPTTNEYQSNFCSHTQLFNSSTPQLFIPHTPKYQTILTILISKHSKYQTLLTVFNCKNSKCQMTLTEIKTKHYHYHFLFTIIVNFEG